MAEDYVKFVENVPAGLGKSFDWQENIPAHPYLGQIGRVLRAEDDAYNTDKPTGYESVWYLVQFPEKDIWLPSSTYVGYDEEKEEDVWVKHLEFVRPT